jgi:hypothetical protein
MVITTIIIIIIIIVVVVVAVKECGEVQIFGNERNKLKLHSQINLEQCSVLQFRTLCLSVPNIKMSRLKYMKL